jgi:hypothetical protein
MPPSSIKAQPATLGTRRRRRPRPGDDEVLLGAELVDHERDPGRSRLDEDDEAALSAVASGRGQPEGGGQGDEGKQSLRRGQHLPAPDRPDLRRHQPPQAHHLRRRQRERPAGRLHEQGPDQRDRQGHGQGERGPGARDGFEPHRAVKGIHLALHDVEADAAARHGSEGPRGGEARMEHEGQEVPILGEVGQSPCARLLADPRPVEAAAIVRHRDLHLGALQGGGEGDEARPRFARGRPLLRRLDPVVHGIADEVEEGILEPFRDRPVELDLVADELELHLLAGGQGHVAHDALQALPGFGEGDHPQAAHARIEFPRRPHQAPATGPGIRHRALEAVLQLLDARPDLQYGRPRLRGRARGEQRLEVAEVRGQTRRRLLEGRPFVAAPLRLSNRQQELAAAGEHGVELVRADAEAVPGAAIGYREAGLRRHGEGRGRRRGRGGQRSGLARDGGEAGGQGGEGRAGERVFLLEARARIFDRIRRREEDREGGRIERPLAVPSPRQDVFQAVAGAFHQLHAHRARGPLQVVRGAEERLKQLRRFALTTLEGEEIVVEAADVVRHLLDEGGHQALDEGCLIHSGCARLHLSGAFPTSEASSAAFSVSMNSLTLIGLVR